MTISVEKEENESTTKGSDRILESKTTPKIVDPEHATRHFGASGSRRVTRFGHLNQRKTSKVFCIRSTLA